MPDARPRGKRLSAREYARRVYFLRGWPAHRIEAELEKLPKPLAREDRKRRRRKRG